MKPTTNHREIAALYDDQRLIKLILETCQLLYTAWRVVNNKGLTEPKEGHPSEAYKGTHVNNRLSVWTRRCYRTYFFVAEHCEALLLEYHDRFKPARPHKCQEHLYWLIANAPEPSQFPMDDREGWIPLPQPKDEKFHVYPMDSWEATAQAFWNYFVTEKLPTARWWHKTPPKEILELARPDQLTNVKPVSSRKRKMIEVN